MVRRPLPLRRTPARALGDRVRRLAAMLLACGALAACTTVDEKPQPVRDLRGNDVRDQRRDAPPPRAEPGGAPPLAGAMTRRRSVIALVSTASLICVAIVVFLKSFVDNPAVAAAGELQRLIELNAHTMDRTYQITVEEAVLPHRGRRGPSPEDGRPPKAPMDGATLYVRDGQQF